MSGGSLGYLYNKDPGDLFEEYNREYLERAEALLLAQGYRDIARDVRRLLEYTYAAENRIGVLFDDLRDVLHAVEWYDSSDYGKDTLRKKLEEYRNGGAQT